MVLFGRPMDYHVFVVSRICEAVLRGVPNREAVAEGCRRCSARRTGGRRACCAAAGGPAAGHPEPQDEKSPELIGAR